MLITEKSYISQTQVPVSNLHLAEHFFSFYGYGFLLHPVCPESICNRLLIT